MWFVYVLLCEDGSLYTGVTNNLEKRFLDHQNGKCGHYTRSHKPVKIVYQEQLKTLSEALKRENQIKNWSRENEPLPAASSGVSRKRDKFLSNHSSPQQSCEVFWFNNKISTLLNTIH